MKRYIIETFIIFSEEEIHKAKLIIEHALLVCDFGTVSHIPSGCLHRFFIAESKNPASQAITAVPASKYLPIPICHFYPVTVGSRVLYGCITIRHLSELGTKIPPHTPPITRQIILKNIIVGKRK